MRMCMSAVALRWCVAAFACRRRREGVRGSRLGFRARGLRLQQCEGQLFRELTVRMGRKEIGDGVEIDHRHAQLPSNPRAIAARSGAGERSPAQACKCSAFAEPLERLELVLVDAERADPGLQGLTRNAEHRRRSVRLRGRSLRAGAEGRLGNQGVPTVDLFNQKMEGTAWRSKPTWYIVGKNDHTVHPELQRFVAKRMGASIHETDSSHVPMLSKPAFVIDVIRTAANAVQGRPAQSRPRR